MIPLLTTKLSIPPRRPRAGVVDRSRLIGRLNASDDRRLTVISAPAGFGKTMLAAEWIPQNPHCVAWLSLDAGDGDPVRFWTYVIAALQALRADLGAGARAALETAQSPPIESILTLLLNDLAAFPDRFALVLDDYHLIETPAIHAALTFLLDHLPPPMRLIIITRSDPPLPLARWRARQQLLEIRAAELRFTPDEAAAFLNQVMGLNLSADDIAALDTRTEGWIAGLQLAALSMQGRDDATSFIRSFTGSHAYIIDYLAEEVVQRQPLEVQLFLLKTSILERLCGPVCNALTDRADSQPLLERLEQANLFISRLDDQREWFRYHHLFAEVLRIRLRRDYAGLEITLHRRASLWHEAHGSPAEAIDHALAAADFERAAQLVESSVWQLIGRGELATLQSWLDRLPAAVVQARPRLGLAYATLMSIINRMDVLEARLNEVDAALVDEAIDDREALLGQSAALRAHVALERDEDLPRALKLCRQALVRIPAQDVLMRSLVMYYLGTVQRLNGDTPGALQTLTQGIELALAAGSPLYTLVFFEAKANVEKAQGNLQQVVATCRRAAAVTAERGWQAHPNAVNARLGLGLLRYEWNEVEAAAQIFRDSLDWARRWGMRFNEIKTCLLLAALPEPIGDRTEAQALIQQALHVARAWHRPYMLRLVEHNAASLALRWGDLDAATRWAEASGRSTADTDLLYQRANEYLTLARVRIAQGRSTEALLLLDRLLAAAEADTRLGDAIEILMLRALAFQAQHDQTAAFTSLDRALTLAEPEGYIRTFVDEGEPMQLLIVDCRMQIEKHNGHLKPYVTKLLAAFPTVPSTSRDLSISNQQSKTPALHQVQRGASVSNLIEPLSERELEVLRLIADGLSNREISERLIVGAGTVKTHINNLYRKLDVNSRTQALHRARELNLL